MTIINDFLTGRKLLQIVDSKYNGELSVVYELGIGNVIFAGGLPQSGGLAKDIWKRSLKEIRNQKSEIRNTLILGFGGGGIAQIIHKSWPESTIIGVDIDLDIVDLGKKYLKWEETNAKVWISDAEKFIDNILLKRELSGESFDNFEFQISNFEFDLICIDMYVGSKLPEKFNTLEFVQKIKKLLSPNGVAVFNRLYGRNDEGQTHEFKAKLDKIFERVDSVYPSANIMYLCWGNSVEEIN